MTNEFADDVLSFVHDLAAIPGRCRDLSQKARTLNAGPDDLARLSALWRELGMQLFAADSIREKAKQKGDELAYNAARDVGEAFATVLTSIKREVYRLIASGARSDDLVAVDDLEVETFIDHSTGRREVVARLNDTLRPIIGEKHIDLPGRGASVVLGPPEGERPYVAYPASWVADQTGRRWREQEQQRIATEQVDRQERERKNEVQKLQKRIAELTA